MTLPPHQGTGVAAGRSALRRTGEKGLLQTEAYMRAVMLAWTTVPSDEEIERTIAVRLKRQERLQGEDAPKVWIVLNEAALRRETGGRATMREQLQRLTDVTRLNRWCCRCLRSLPGHILRWTARLCFSGSPNPPIRTSHTFSTAGEAFTWRKRPMWTPMLKYSTTFARGHSAQTS